MSYQLNELEVTFTLVVGEAAYFRIEIFRASNEPERWFYFSEVYLLRWPNGMTVMKGLESDTAFRQLWHYLDDFPAVRSDSLEETKMHVVNLVQGYGLQYLAAFTPKTKLQR